MLPEACVVIWIIERLAVSMCLRCRCDNRSLSVLSSALEEQLLTIEHCTATRLHWQWHHYRPRSILWIVTTAGCKLHCCHIDVSAFMTVWHLKVRGLQYHDARPNLYLLEAAAAAALVGMGCH